MEYTIKIWKTSTVKEVKQRTTLRSLLRVLFYFCMLCDVKFKFALKIALPILLILVAGTLFFLACSRRKSGCPLLYRTEEKTLRRR